MAFTKIVLEQRYLDIIAPIEKPKYIIKGKKKKDFYYYFFFLIFFCRSITSLASSTASSDKKPSRPKSFSIHRLFKKQPKEHCKENCNCDECATKILSKTVSELPKIKCSFVSAPATPINHHIARYKTFTITQWARIWGKKLKLAWKAKK